MVVTKGLDLEGELLLKLNPLNLLAPLTKKKFKGGDETEIMAAELLSFIKTLRKAYKIIKVI